MSIRQHYYCGRCGHSVATNHENRKTTVAAGPAWWDETDVWIVHFSRTKPVLFYDSVSGTPTTKHSTMTQKSVSVPNIQIILYYTCRSQWPWGLRHRSAAASLLRLRVRIPPGACLSVCLSVCCEYCVLSGTGLCDELITRPQESYRLLCVVGCDLETSWMTRPWPTVGCYPPPKKKLY